MKRYLFSFICLFTVTFLSAQSTSRSLQVATNNNTLVSDTLSAKSSGAIITFPPTKFNIGNVLKGNELTDTLVFSNTGNEPLLITNVRTSCHCTVATFSKVPVLPNESGRVILKLDTKMPGQFTKVIAIYSNAMNKPRALLHIRWTVVKSLGKGNATQLLDDSIVK